MSTPEQNLTEREMSPDELIDFVGREYRVPKGLRQSLFKRESGGQQYNPDGSVKVATYAPHARAGRGIGQLIPGTAKQLGVNPDDPVENVVGSIHYLKSLYDQARPSSADDAEAWAKATAGYFSGPGNMGARPGEVFREDRSDGRVKVSEYVTGVLSGWADHDGPDNDWDEPTFPQGLTKGVVSPAPTPPSQSEAVGASPARPPSASVSEVEERPEDFADLQRPAPSLYTPEGRAARDAKIQAEAQGGALYRIPVGSGATAEAVKAGVEQLAKDTQLPPGFVESWLKDKGLGLYEQGTGKALESSPTGYAAIPTEMVGQMRKDYRASLSLPSRAVANVKEIAATRTPGEVLTGVGGEVASGALRGMDIGTRPLQAASAAFWAKVKGADDVTALKTAAQEFMGEQPELAKNLFAEMARSGKIPVGPEDLAIMAAGGEPRMIDIAKVNPRLPEMLGFITEMVADPTNLIPGGLIAKGAKTLGRAGKAGGRLARFAEGMRDIGVYEPDIPREAFKPLGDTRVLGDLTRRADRVNVPDVPAGTIPAPRLVKGELRAQSPQAETGVPEAVPAQKPSVAGQQASASPITETIIRHSDPRIDGGKVIGQTSDGKLRVENNEGGVSVVQHPRRGGNREAALVRREVVNAEDATRTPDSGDVQPLAAGSGSAPTIPEAIRVDAERPAVAAGGAVDARTAEVSGVAEGQSGATASGVAEPPSLDRLNAPVPGPRAFRAQMKKHFNLDDRKADAVLELTEARARAWAKEQGKDASDYYVERFAGIVRGGESGPGALNQAAPKTPEFKSWFGKSKVVDESGEPLTVYHGTPTPDFDSFSKGTFNRRTRGEPGSRDAFFFTRSPDSADAYAYDSASGKSGAIIPAHIKLENPLRLEKSPTAADITRAKAAGHDGIVTPYEYAVFEPTQIKSATGNRGTFDPSDPNILRQQNKAAVEFLKDSRAIIRAFSQADVSSAVHELGHVFRRDLPDNLLKDAEDAIGVKNGKWTTPDEEKFARGFERYLKTGNAPTEKLRAVYAQFKTWLTEIYGAVRGKGHELAFKPNEKLVSVFDRMLDASPKGEYGQLTHALHKAPDAGTPAFFENAQVKRALGLKPDASTEDVRWALAGAVGKPRSSHVTPEDVRAWADSKRLGDDARKALDFAVGQYDAKAGKADTADATPESLAPADSLIQNDPQFIENYYTGKTTDAEFIRRAREAGLNRAEIRAVIADAREARGKRSAEAVPPRVREGEAERGGGAGRNREGDVDVLYQSAERPASVMFSTRDVREMRREKDALRARGYRPADVKRFVDRYYRGERYEELRGGDNVYLVMPSTSGENRIPEVLARRLRADFGGEIVTDFAIPLAKAEAKKKGFLAKIADPSRYELTRDLSALKDRNVVIVDDVLNTGESLTGLRLALRAQGIETGRVISLGASESRLVSARDVDRLAKKLATRLGKDYNDTRQKVADVLAGSFKQFANYAERTADGSPNAAKRIYEYFARESETFRADARRNEALQRGAGGGQEPDTPGLRRGDVSGVPPLAADEAGAVGGERVRREGEPPLDTPADDPDILYQSSESDILKRFREVTAKARTGEAKRLEQSIADLERRIEEKDFTPKDRPQPRAVAAEVASLRAQRDGLRTEYEALKRSMPVQGPRLSEGRGRKEGPQLAEAPLQGPKQAEVVPGRDSNLTDLFRTPLSNLDFKGTYERLGGEPGKKVSDAFRDAQFQTDERLNELRKTTPEDKLEEVERVVRREELDRLKSKLRPLVKQLKDGGKPDLADDVLAHLNALSGTPTKFEKQVGNLIRETPGLGRMVKNPDLAMRHAAARLTGLQATLKLKYNIRSSIVNLTDPLTTLWPYASTADMAAVYADFLKPSTRKMLADRGVTGGVTKLDEAGLVKTRQGLGDKLSPFRKASEVNRSVAYLYGLKEAKRAGKVGEDAHRLALDWAKKVEFDNSVWNAPPVLRTSAGKVLGQFKGYAVKSFENLANVVRKKETDKAFTRAARVSKFVAGKGVVGGVRAGGVLTKAAGYYAAGALAYQLMQKGYSKEEAQKVADAVYYGAPALIGLDLSGSVMMFEPPFGNSLTEQVVNTVGGPTIGTGLKLGQAAKDAYSAEDGKQKSREEKLQTIGERSINALTPYYKMGRSGVQTIQGSPTQKLNDKEVPVTTYEGVMKALGFTLTKQTRFYDEKDFQKPNTGRRPSTARPSR